MNKALFLDRDGVINKNFGHVHRINNFKFRKGIFELLKIFQDNGYIILVITNQAGIGKGLYTIDQFHFLNTWMINQFYNQGIIITKTYYCPHKPEDKCNCRKPKPGMIIQALIEHEIDSKASIFIGDKQTDLDAAIAAKIGFVYNLSRFQTISRLYKILIKEFLL